jgi:hypothetical protein
MNGKRLRISNLRSPISNCLILFLLLASASLAFAADPPRKGGDSKAGDEYDRELLGDPARPDDKVPAGEALERKLRRELGSASQREDKSKAPLEKIAGEMRDILPRLDKHDSGKVTQYLQQQIVADLDQIIEEAKKSEAKGGRSPGVKSNDKRNTPRPNGEVKSKVPTGNSDSKPREPDKDRAKELAEARERMKQLFRANLPEHARDQVFEEPSEYFLPEYQAEIEDYFRRLSAEEKPAASNPKYETNPK